MIMHCGNMQKTQISTFLLSSIIHKWTCLKWNVLNQKGHALFMSSPHHIRLSAFLEWADFSIKYGCIPQNQWQYHSDHMIVCLYLIICLPEWDGPIITFGCNMISKDDNTLLRCSKCISNRLYIPCLKQLFWIHPFP